MREVVLSWVVVSCFWACGPTPLPPVDGGATTGDGGSSSGCIQFNALVHMPPPTPASASFNISPEGIGVNSMGLVNRTQSTTMPVNVTVEAFLYNRQPTVAPAVPLNGTFTTSSDGVRVFARSFFGIDCSAAGENCRIDYVSVSGTYSISQATNATATGRFAGTFSNVRYERIDLNTFRLVPDGGCIEVPSVTFATSW